MNRRTTRDMEKGEKAREWKENPHTPFNMKGPHVHISTSIRFVSVVYCSRNRESPNKYITPLYRGSYPDMIPSHDHLASSKLEHTPTGEVGGTNKHNPPIQQQHNHNPCSRVCLCQACQHPPTAAAVQHMMKPCIVPEKSRADACALLFLLSTWKL